MWSFQSMEKNALIADLGSKPESKLKGVMTMARRPARSEIGHRDPPVFERRAPAPLGGQASVGQH